MVFRKPNVVIRKWAIIPLLIALFPWLWLSADGRLHWDEPGYLYYGTYQSYQKIIDGHVQPGPEFSIGRILHILFIRSVMNITENSSSTFKVLVFFNLTMIIVSLWFTYKILQILLPDMIECSASIVLLAMTPVFIYLSFKTLPDTEALATATVATYTLVLSVRNRNVYWCVPSAIGLALTALIKVQAVFLPFGFWMAGCLIPISGIDRRRLFFLGIVSGVGGIIFTLVMLNTMEIGVERYINSYMTTFESELPFSAKMFNILTELGLLWFLLAVSVWSRRRRELRFFWLWVFFSTAFFVLFIEDIEPRHLTVNLVAVGGLFAVSLEAINKRHHLWRRSSGRRKSLIAGLGLSIIMICDFPTLSVMPHEVDIRQLNKMVRTLENRYGPGNYTILTPWGYTNFHILRVLWPEIDVRKLLDFKTRENEDCQEKKLAFDAYYHGRYHCNIGDIPRTEKRLIFMSYVHTFAAENLKAMLKQVSPNLAVRLLGNLKLVDHLYSDASRWLWDNPDVRLQPIANIGHYHAFEISIQPNMYGNDVRSQRSSD